MAALDSCLSEVTNHLRRNVNASIIRQIFTKKLLPFTKFKTKTLHKMLLSSKS